MEVSGYVVPHSPIIMSELLCIAPYQMRFIFDRWMNSSADDITRLSPLHYPSAELFSIITNWFGDEWRSPGMLYHTAHHKVRVVMYSTVPNEVHIRSVDELIGG